MTKKKTDLVELFCEKSAIVSSQIYEAVDMKDAAKYIALKVSEKEPCELLAEEIGTSKGPLSKSGNPTRLNKFIAVPGLELSEQKIMEKICEPYGINILTSGMRNYLAGIDASVAHAQLGIAESGTCLVKSDDENMRISTMICEISFLILKKSNIRQDLLAIADDLRAIQKKGSSHTSFITGPSRTADIERVLAIGVHGPLELHVILLED